MCIYVSVHMSAVAQGCQQRVSDLLELVLLEAVSHQVWVLLGTELQSSETVLRALGH